MSLQEYADRFKTKNPTIPEHLYGRFAKIERVVEQANAVTGLEPEVGPSVSVSRLVPVTSSSTSSDPTTNNNLPIPKISLRRNSSQGPGWIKAPSGETTNPAVSADSNPISTMMVAGNAVSSMFGAIRATFKPAADVNSLASQNGVKNLSQPPLQVEKETVIRSSSASRGRGLKRQ